MCKRNKVCIYMFIVVMVLQIIIPALSVILETSYTLISEADVITEWDIGASGSNITAKLYDSGTLYIEGEGAIKDDTEWKFRTTDVRDWITTVQIKGNITTIGKMAFFGFRNLEACIDFDKSVKVVKNQAFGKCPKLERADFPNLEIAEKYAFSDCERLTIAIPYDIKE